MKGVNNRADEAEWPVLTILLALALFAVPLTDARPAGVGKHGAANGFKIALQAVTLDGGVDELRSRIKSCQLHCGHGGGFGTHPGVIMNGVCDEIPFAFA